MMSLTFGLFTQVSGSGPLGPLVSKPRFYYHVSGQSSSANEIASYLILMNIHKSGHMIDEWSHDRRITQVVESLAKVYKSEE